MIYKTCRLCGGNLDPEEACDCREQEMLKKHELLKRKSRAELEAELGFVTVPNNLY